MQGMNAHAKIVILGKKRFATINPRTCLQELAQSTHLMGQRAEGAAGRESRDSDAEHGRLAAFCTAQGASDTHSRDCTDGAKQVHNLGHVYVCVSHGITKSTG